MSVDLAPYLPAVPDAVVGRLRAARRVLAVSHENPDADTLGAALGVARLVEALGGTADLLCTDPVPPLYDFMAGSERFRTDPDPDATYDLPSSSTAARSSGSATSASATPTCSSGCRG